LLIWGCGDTSRPVIGVVPKGSGTFWQTAHAGAVKASLEYGLEIEWNAPAAETDAGRQVAIVESMISRHLAGIVLAPIDRKVLAPVVEGANTAGIPVSVFDSELDTPNRITWVGANQRESGRMAARELGSILVGEGRVAWIGHLPASAATIERAAGIAEELKRSFKKMQMVRTVYSMGDRTRATAVAESILDDYPDLRGLITDGEASSAGAVAALKARGNSRVRTVAFDANDQLINDLQDRIIDAIIVQNPFLMGYESVKAIGMSRKRQTPAKFIDSGVYLVNRQTLEKPEVVELVRPDLARWLSSKSN
jgi:ribose transport system substrate-binding protein